MNKMQSLCFWLVLILSALLASQIFRLKLDTDLTHRFLPEDPAILAGQEEKTLFKKGSEIFLFATWDNQSPSKIQTETWKKELITLPGIQNVVTPFDWPTLFWESPSKWTLKQSQETSVVNLAKNPALRKILFHKKGSGMTLVLRLDEDDNLKGEGALLLNRLEDWIQKQPPQFHFEMSGLLPLNHFVTQSSLSDLKVIGAVMFVCVFLLLFYFFRSFWVVFVVIGVSGLGVVTTLGLIGLIGPGVDPFSLMAIPIIFAIGLLDSIHLAYGYQSWKKLLTPCFWTSLTTIAGFSVLLTSDLLQVQTMGKLVICGTAMAFVLSLSLIPVFLGWISPRAAKKLPLRFGDLVLGVRPRVVVFICLVLFLVSLPGLFRIRILPDYPKLFSDDHPFVLDLKQKERDWGGLTSVSYLLNLKEGMRYSDPVVMTRLRDFVQLLSRRAHVTDVISPLDFLDHAQREYQKRFETRMPRPLFLQMTNNLFSSQPGKMSPLKEWFDPKTETFRVVARIPILVAEDFPQLARDLYGFQKNLSDLFDVRLTGFPLLFKNLEASLLSELYRSFVYAFAVVSILLFIFLRSFRWWLVAIISNVLPFAVVLGLLGLLDSGFNLGLLLAPGIALGLVVDDTIHFLHFVRHHWKRGEDLSVVLKKAFQDVGSALFITTSVLGIGFACLFLSSFQSHHVLALVMVAIVILALAADLFLLPALIKITNRPKPFFAKEL